MRWRSGATSAMRAQGQGSLERSASAPQVHKPCQCRNGKLCMRAMKGNECGGDCDNRTTLEVKKVMKGSRGQNAR
eukprot:2135740-Pleurochrysis_carterae.AAC.1